MRFSVALQTCACDCLALAVSMSSGDAVAERVPF